VTNFFSFLPSGQAIMVEPGRSAYQRHSSHSPSLPGFCFPVPRQAMVVAVDFQRLADHQLNLECGFILLLRQLNHLTLHAFFRFRERRDFSSGWSANAPADMQAAVSRETASVVIFFTVDHPLFSFLTEIAYHSSAEC
jgi:hypothetical protein